VGLNTIDYKNIVCDK